MATRVVAFGPNTPAGSRAEPKSTGVGDLLAGGDGAGVGDLLAGAGAVGRLIGGDGAGPCGVTRGEAKVAVAGDAVPDGLVEAVVVTP